MHGSNWRSLLRWARVERYPEQTVNQLGRRGTRLDALLFGLPVGERILIINEKPSVLRTAWAVSVVRDAGIPRAFLREHHAHGFEHIS